MVVLPAIFSQMIFAQESIEERDHAGLTLLGLQVWWWWEYWSRLQNLENSSLYC